MVGKVLGGEFLHVHRGGGRFWFPNSSVERRQIVGLLVWQVCALAGQVAAVVLARQEHRPLAELLSNLSLALMYTSALWVLTALSLTRRSRNAAVGCLGVFPVLMWRASNPLLFTGFDEQLHMRTLGDIISSHGLFQANPLLEVSPRYPGLEATTTLVHQLGIPTMAAAYVVIIVSRLILVTVLCDTVEQLTGSSRAGGIAVAVYAISPQFVFFNSQYAYQTMAIPLALAVVSLVARARLSDNPLPLLGGATVCLFAVAVTHHVTSLLTALFLIVWTLPERRAVRLWVAYGACAAVASTIVWAFVQRRLLTNYFKPIIDDVAAQFRGGDRRELFKDSAGTAARSLDQYLLIYYAAILSLIVAVLLLLSYRWWRKGEHFRGGLHLIAVLISGSIPVLLAARVLPKGGELFDRSSSFLFFPLSYVVASYAVRLWWRADQPPSTGREHRRIEIVRGAAVGLAALAFLGGYVLGSGPSWQRLPGSYLVAADARSMDSETLAAVKWARNELPAGSRIGADGVSSALFASQAGVWPVLKGPDGIDVPALFVAKTWGLEQTDEAAVMQLRFLYVDSRLADELPHYGAYFFSGETGEGQQLTARQLNKFDRVPGIKLIYRHGPVSIYDLQELGIPELRSGWFEPTPHVRPSTQLAVGLAIGLLLAVVMRNGLGSRIRQSWTRCRRAWGAALTAAIVLAGVCLTSVLLLLAGVWMTPLTFLSAGLVIVLTNYQMIGSVVRRAAGTVSRRDIRTAVMVAVPLALILAVAVWNAAIEVDFNVNRILEDPAAVHISPKSPDK